MIDSTSNPLVEIRAAYKALANDPPNSITTMRALKALGSAIEEIQKLQIECMRRGAEVGRSAVETTDSREALSHDLEKVQTELDASELKYQRLVDAVRHYIAHGDGSSKMLEVIEGLPEEPTEGYTQEALDAAHARTRERLSKLKIEESPHWAKDSMVPVEGCHCETCVDARSGENGTAP